MMTHESLATSIGILQIKRLTGGDIGSIDQLEEVIKSTEWSVIVATPQTVFNYFLAFK